MAEIIYKISDGVLECRNEISRLMKDHNTGEPLDLFAQEYKDFADRKDYYYCKWQILEHKFRNDNELTEKQTKRIKRKTETAYETWRQLYDWEMRFTAQIL